MKRHPLNRSKALVDSVDELGITEPKSIRYSNTRLFSQEELEEAARKAGVPASPSHSNIAAAISGTPCKGLLYTCDNLNGLTLFIQIMADLRIHLLLECMATPLSIPCRHLHHPNWELPDLLL